MRESLPSPSRLSSRRRTAALLGLVALAFFQVSVAAHQFQHVSDHGLNICQICSSHNQLDNAPVSATVRTELPIVQNVLVGPKADLFQPPIVTAPYHSRAPPLS